MTDDELMPSEELIVVPSTKEFALLSAARSGRLRRFYYTGEHVDAITSAGFSSGGKADSQALSLMAHRGWLKPVPDISDSFDWYWKITEAGDEARKRYLSQPKGKRKK